MIHKNSIFQNFEGFASPRLAPKLAKSANQSLLEKVDRS
jgi:hypothetical protein